MTTKQHLSISKMPLSSICINALLSKQELLIMSLRLVTAI